MHEEIPEIFEERIEYPTHISFVVDPTPPEEEDA